MLTVSETSIGKQVIDACLSAGIREYVVCAGARNLSLVAALAGAEEVIVWSHFEERAAGFFALGRMMDSREPCAVVTTSGTAVAELLPAVIESHYQGRPLVVISADRPAGYRGSGAPQVIDQVGIFNAYAESCIDVRTGAEECFSGWSMRRPWHVNVCVEETDAMIASDAQLAEFKPVREKLEVGGLLKFFDACWQGVVVCLGGLEPEDRGEVMHFLQEIKVPVLADATSGLRELLGNLVLADGDRVLKKVKPAKVLRIGEVPVGRFWRDLEEMPEVEVLSLSRTGFSGLARESQVITGQIGRIIRGVGEIGEVGDVLDLLKENSRRWSQIDELLESYPDSEPSMIRTLSIYASIADTLYLGNSLPIREWAQFSQREHPIEIIRANRGANGIDGQLATWAGLTYGTDDAWCVVGDLTAMYDLSAPALLDGCEGGGRVIVVLNNGGGKIFDRLPRVAKMDGQVRDVIANSHGYSFEAWAAMWGMDYMRADSAEEMEVEAGEVPLVVEVCPCDKQTQAFWKAYEAMEGGGG
ncbi:2-succinyl-5-enolpyruvyl-6-hydroxy-3-cyclohexene-1-carboxylate synthase [Rubritalea squalenifaciens DSM 18772]|uniref:2-succinyl-5-enolpyruvyl-6-hydroxy-3-cyclohexene-1-carboxylate synthase n=1 Tax=Rubritalea squalenifaciens DSM 18772 TaxID=1123071 RepID=A0A1M6MCP0_9BACT|nr:2-succinyl-5-enolpyruvyl-6-hydroxy-3-cyclohexene-1-carboxylate synthase [Rubritalea squalenifaciens DSM 18772]